MADFDKRMDELAERAKQAHARAHATATRTKQALQEELLAARASVDEANKRLEGKATDVQDEATKRWNTARQEWAAHLAKLREKHDTEKAKHDLHHAQRRAERAEWEAEDAIDFAIYAVDAAEYAVLDAVLANAEAEELASANA